MRHRSRDRETIARKQDVFEKYGARIYDDVDPDLDAFRQCFNLSDAKLRDILNATTERAPLSELDEELCCSEGNPLEPISARRLWQYLLLCRIGRFVFRQHGLDPDTFASEETMQLAKRLRRNRSRVTHAAA